MKTLTWMMLVGAEELNVSIVFVKLIVVLPDKEKIFHHDFMFVYHVVGSIEYFFE